MTTGGEPRVRHRLSPGWAIALAVIVIVAGLGAYFLRSQVQHNGRTNDALVADAKALKLEVDRAATAECALLNGRRLLFHDLSLWLDVEATTEPGIGGTHAAAARALQAKIDQQLRTEKLPHCKLVPIP